MVYLWFALLSVRLFFMIMVLGVSVAILVIVAWFISLGCGLVFLGTRSTGPRVGLLLLVL